MAINETSVDGKKYRQKTTDGWKWYSFITKAKDILFGDGDDANNNLETNLGSFKGITTSTNVTEAGYAADATVVSQLNDSLGDLSSIGTDELDSVTKIFQHYIDNGFLPPLQRLVLYNNGVYSDILGSNVVNYNSGKRTDDSDSFTVTGNTASANGWTFFTNQLDLSNYSKIYVEYTATVNNNASFRITSDTTNTSPTGTYLPFSTTDEKKILQYDVSSLTSGYVAFSIYNATVKIYSIYLL